MQAPAPVKRNPNASLAGGLTGVSTLVVYVAGLIGASLTTTQAVLIGGGITTGGLWLGKAGGRAMAFFAKRGVVGMARLVWRGDRSE